MPSRRSALFRWFVFLGLLLLVGCGGKPEATATAPSTPAANAASPANSAEGSAATAETNRPLRQPGQDASDTRPVIVAFGDSLSAGFGLEAGQSYPDYLQAMLDSKGYAYRVVNQGVSGDTTSGGMARMDQALALKPAIVILELGGNDGLRGLPIAITRQNLDQMTDTFQKAGAQVVLAGLTLPRNYGESYIREFEQIYPTLEKKYRCRRIRFLLEGVAMKPGLMQADGIHPTAEGCKIVAANVFAVLEPLLRK